MAPSRDAREQRGCGESHGLVIRELSPHGRAVLPFVFGRLGARSRQQRFLAVKQRLHAHEIERLIDVDHWHREALVAWTPPPRAPVGVARYSRREQFDRAELAVAVVDEWQRRGVGRALLEALSRRALRAGVRHFELSTLIDNHGAMALVRHAGPLQPIALEGGVAEMIVDVASLAGAPSKERQ